MLKLKIHMSILILNLIFCSHLYASAGFGLVALHSKYVTHQSEQAHQYCSGTVIDDHWVLTVAHCGFLDEISIQSYEKDTELNTRINHDKVTVFEDDFIAHEKFDFNRKATHPLYGKYDIALIYWTKLCQKVGDVSS